MEERKETGRVEAFSNGVFAVAITLLVLNIKVPGSDLLDKQWWKTLDDEWPMLVAYGTSEAIFLTWFRRLV